MKVTICELKREDWQAALRAVKPKRGPSRKNNLLIQGREISLCSSPLVSSAEALKKGDASIQIALNRGEGRSGEIHLVKSNWAIYQKMIQLAWTNDGREGRWFNANHKNQREFFQKQIEKLDNRAKVLSRL